MKVKPKPSCLGKATALSGAIGAVADMRALREPSGEELRQRAVEQIGRLVKYIETGGLNARRDGNRAVLD